MNLRTTLTVLIIFVGITQGMSKGGSLPLDEFARRRAIFLDELRELDAIAILHSAPELERNHDVEFPYRQESNFIYLTGWSYPNAILVLSPHVENSGLAEVSLFVNPRDAKREIWTGPVEGIEEALLHPGVDQAMAYDNFMDSLPKLAKGFERLVISYGGDTEFRTEMRSFIDDSRVHPTIVQEAASLIKAHRLIKSETEIQAMQKAIDVTGASLMETFPLIPKLNYEYEVQAEIEYGFKKRGSPRLGFPCIVGAGKNSTFLHYRDNHGKLDSNSVILMDVGAEWDFYSADITRTVPVSGKFSKEQAQIYQLVLDAQTAAIESLKPGVDFGETNKIASEVITAGLVKLGLLSGDVETLIAERKYRKFFMHGTSHWLGLDVHDAGGYVNADGEKHKLKAGMVLTVEPGIYISESEDVDPKWWNIGVRIEDDVLITKRGNRVLSAEIPKTIEDIEAIIQAR